MERLIGAVLPAFFSSIPVGFERTHVTVNLDLTKCKETGEITVILAGLKKIVRYTENFVI